MARHHYLLQRSSVTHIRLDKPNKPLSAWGHEWSLVCAEKEIKNYLSLKTSDAIIAGDDNVRITSFVEGLFQVGSLNMLLIGSSHIRSRLEVLKHRINELNEAAGQSNIENLQLNFAAKASGRKQRSHGLRSTISWRIAKIQIRRG